MAKFRRALWWASSENGHGQHVVMINKDLTSGHGWRMLASSYHLLALTATSSLPEPIIPRHMFRSLLLIHTHLFLRSSRLLSLSLCPLLPHTHQSSLAPRISQLPIRSLLSLWHIARTDLTNSVLLRRVLDWQDMVHLMSPLVLALGVGLDIFFAAIDFLVLAGAAGEENQAFAVSL